VYFKTRSALDRAHLPPTTVFRRLKTTRRCQYVGFSRRNKIPCCSAYDSNAQNHASLLRRAPNTDFPDVIRFRVAVHMLWEKAIRFRHPNYDLDRAQQLISSSMSRHLSTRDISSKSMHTILSNLAHRQTNELGRAGENIYLLRCWR